MAEWMSQELVWPDDRADAVAGTPLRLQAGRCEECGRSSFPSTGQCTWCGGETGEFALATSGTLVAATAVLHKTPGCDLQTPYVVGLVRFPAANLDILGRVVDTKDPAQLDVPAELTVVADASFSEGRLHFAFRVTS